MLRNCWHYGFIFRSDKVCDQLTDVNTKKINGRCTWRRIRLKIHNIWIFFFIWIFLFLPFQTTAPPVDKPNFLEFVNHYVNMFNVSMQNPNSFQISEGRSNLNEDIENFRVVKFFKRPTFWYNVLVQIKLIIIHVNSFLNDLF